jgi:hypothetical protein
MNDRNADMRHILSQIQTVQQSLERQPLAEDANIDLSVAQNNLKQSLPGNGLETVRHYIRAEAGLDPYGGQDPEDFDSLLNDWCEDAVYQVAGKLRSMIRGEHLRAWREITAGENWTPEQQHPGIYWSWDENAAEAHWGGHDHEGHGPVTWKMEALLTTSQIDWPVTLTMNANPDYEEEKEVRILPNTPVQIVRYWRD